MISIIMIGLVFMTTEFNCDDMKAARQEQSASEGNISGQQNKDGLQTSESRKRIRQIWK